MTVRCQITAVSRQADTIAAQYEILGWRAHVTNVPSTQLTQAHAILTYRDEWLVEQEVVEHEPLVDEAEAFVSR